MRTSAESVGAHQRRGPDDPDPEYLKAMDALDDGSPSEGDEVVSAREGGGRHPGDSRREPGRG
jgi:hypothetical protein